jgi:ABC-2 type transport system permease protein
MRALRVIGAQLRSSLLTAMQYRADFLIDALVELSWLLTAVYPLFVVFEHAGSVGGYSLDAALMVAGVFSILQGIMEGLIAPSFTRLVEQVRKGTLDFVLTKPLDAQLLVSFSKLEPWRCINVIAGTALILRSLARASHLPSALDVGVFGAMLVSSACILYALWVMAACSVFYVVRADNITYLFSSIFDAARWPRTVFRGGLRVLLTFLIPLGVMTSFPAEALRGIWTGWTLLTSVATAFVFLCVSRVFWLRATAHYGSAGG